MKTILSAFGILFLTSVNAQILDIQDFYSTEFTEETDIQNLGNKLSNYNSEYYEGLNLFLASVRKYDNDHSGGLMIAGFGNKGKLKLTHNLTNKLLAMLPKNINQETFLSFGVCSSGDLNDDGIDDLVVGIPRFLNSEKEEDKLVLFFMNKDFSPESIKIINGTNLGFEVDYELGYNVSNIGDWDDNGYDDLAVSLPGYKTGYGINDYYGAIGILFLDKNGKILKSKIIKNQDTQIREVSWGFATSILGTKDFNHDGIRDLAIGTPHGQNNGIVNIYYLDNEQDIISTAEISRWTLPSELFLKDDHFGQAITSPGDLNDDGIPELLISMHWSERDNYHAGKLLVVSLDNEGNIISHAQIFDKKLEEDYLEIHDHLGRSVIMLNDMNGDGIDEIFVTVDDVQNHYNGKLRLINTDYSYLLGTITNTDLIKDQIKQINLFPNPSTDIINIQNTNLIGSRYKIINLNGINIQTGTIEQSLKVNIGALANGHYHFICKNSKGMEHISKFIKS